MDLLEDEHFVAMSWSAVRVASVTNGDYIHELPGIVDGVENAVVTDTDPPEI
jgi:hypothetical protein